MFARVSKYTGSTDKIDSGIRHADQTTPDLERMEGFLGSYLLVDRQGGKALSITIWDSMEHVQASVGSANPLRQAISDAFGATEPPQVEVYEVALTNTHRLRQAA